MRRGKSSVHQRRLLWILSIIIVTSMICSFAVSLRPPRAPTPTALPTIEAAPAVERATDTPIAEETPEPATAAPPETRATATP